MKAAMNLVSLLVVLVLCAGVAVAGCGHKETVEGTLQSVDEEANTVVVVGDDGKKVELGITAETKVTDAEGNEAELSKLIGKGVKVVSEHAKVDSITQTT